MNTEIAIKEKEEIIAKKRAAWGNLGVAVYESEMQLQARAQKAISQLKYPKTIEEVAEAEAVLKVVKAEESSIEKDRKDVTSRFDDVTSRLMLAAKSIKEPYLKSYNMIVAVKSEHAKKEAVKQQKNDEIKFIKEKIASYLSNAVMEMKSRIAIQVTAAYEHALTTDVKPESIKAFVQKCYSGLTSTDFKLEAPFIKLNLVQIEELQLILDETFNHDPNVYVQIYQDELDRQFVDYAVAYNNKVEALQLAKAQETKKQADIKSENDQNTLAASLASQSTSINFTAEDAAPEVKALKKSFEVNMVETPENAILLMRAFVANFELCNTKLRVTKWFSITPAQMAGALSKLKCEDNQFQPQGIIFKEVEKL